MDILIVTPETYPFVRGGSLADATGALPKALRALGHKVTVLSLLYKHIDPAQYALARRLARVQVPLGDQTVGVEVYETRLPSGVQITLLHAPGYTDRDVNSDDEALRLAVLLSRGAVEWVRAQSRPVDVIHTFDWSAGLVPLYLRLLSPHDAKLQHPRTVLSLHAPDAQGWFDASALAVAHVPTSFATAEMLGRDGRVSLLRAGVRYADRVTSVSGAWARGVMDASSTTFAPGSFEAAVRARGREVSGVNHGVDYAVWNPTTDAHLASRYDAVDPSSRAACRADLLSVLSLSVRPQAALLGYVGSLDHASGFDLLLDIAPRLMRQDIQLVILGRPGGDASLVARAEELAKVFPERVAFRHGLDEPLAHKIMAGVDLYLRPSRAELDGLSHLYAMRYGAVPVARATAVVRDALVDCDPRLESGTGFLFPRADADEFLGAIGRGVLALRDPEAFAKVRARGMSRDVSWERAGRLYQGVYAAVTSAGQGESAASRA